MGVKGTKEPWGTKDGQSNLLVCIDKLFSKPANFDDSGFVKAELITPELASALSHISDTDKKQLMRHGYEFICFSGMEDALIFKYVRESPKKHYGLKLYYNQHYPKEVAKMMKEVELDVECEE